MFSTWISPPGSAQNVSDPDRPPNGSHLHVKDEITVTGDRVLFESKRPRSYEDAFLWAVEGGTRSFMIAYGCRSSFLFLLKFSKVLSGKYIYIY